MKAHFHNDGVVVELTRRNLKTLLAKLDGHPRRSAGQILKHVDDRIVVIQAVEDEAHYSDRPAGMMHPETEQAMSDE